MEKDAREYEIPVLMLDEKSEPLFGEGVEIIHTEGPRSILLSYPIKKHASAFLRVYIVRCAPDSAVGLTARLSNQDIVLRSMIITPPVITRRRPTQELRKEQVVAEVKPPRAEAITNEALEEALEKILDTNESR